MSLATEVIVAAIGLAGVTITAVFSYLTNQKQKQKTAIAVTENKFHRNSYLFSTFLQYWPQVLDDVRHLMEHSEIDRFLILRACNGVAVPKKTTAIYQMRQGEQAPVSYFHFAVDDHYRDLIRDSKKDVLILDVEKMPQSILKDVYNAEGVVSSLFCYIHGQDLGEGSYAHTYCTFASHTEQLSRETQTKCRIILDRMRAIAYESEIPL